MQHRVGAEILVDPAVEGGKGVRGGEAALEQQAHRIALVAEGGLYADEHVAELRAEHEDGLAVALLAARGGAPLALDVGQPVLRTHVLVGGDAGGHVGVRAVQRGVALQDGGAQRVHAVWHIDRVAGGAEALQRVVQGGEYGEVGGGAGRTRIRREVEEHGSNLAVGAAGAAHAHELFHTLGERGRAFRVGDHVAALLAVATLAGIGGLGAAAASAIRHRQDAAVQLRDGDHDRGLHRQQAARIFLPGRERLEFHRVRGDVGHVQRRQHRLGGVAIVVGGATDKREPGQRDDGIHLHHAVTQEIAGDRGPLVQPAGEGGDDAQAALFQRGDHAVIMRGVAGQQVGPQKQHANRTAGAPGGQLLHAGDDAAWRARVVEPDIGVFHRRFDLCQRQRRRLAVALDQHAQQVGEVFFRAGQPVLQRQEIRAHVLRGAWDEAHQLGQPLQHAHLRLTAARLGATLAGRLAAQLLQHRQRARGLLRHVETPEPGQPRDLACRHAAQHRVARLAPCQQSGLHGAHVIFQEQHGGDHDVPTRDVRVAGGEGRRVAAPFVRRVHDQAQPGHLGAQGRLGARRGCGQVAVHGDDDHAQGRVLSVHDVPWRRRACRA